VSERNIRLLIAYDGTDYCGWQRQNNGKTIQGTLEEKISKITGEHITVNGAGRTDAGVHALGMTANFMTQVQMSALAFHNALNSMLPKAIRILAATEENISFHARYNATGKTYSYSVFTGSIQPPHDRHYCTHSPQQFDLNKVQSGLRYMLGSHDFSSFEASGSRDTTRTGGRGAVRTLFKAECTANPEKQNYFTFTFTGDGFLRHMVRNIVGTFFCVGSNRIAPDEIRTILARKNRQYAGPTAPACGLFLKTVYYCPLPRHNSNT